MKRIWIWALIAGALALTGIWPLESRDVAELEPARVLLVRTEKGSVEVACESAAGSGRTLDEALTDMQNTAEGVLFLDTAEQILLHASAHELLPQAAQSGYLRPAAKVYLVEGELPEAERAAEYLQTHSGQATLGRVHAALAGAGGTVLPHLQNREGRLCLIEQ